MSFPRRIATFALIATLAAQLGGGQRAARADAGQPAATNPVERAALVAERARVRAQLDRVNAEIDNLKRAAASSRLGMRDDYRLRARLADAEALARRLTEIDARLGSPARPGTAQPAPALGAAPALSAADGPAEMEAKADILADQARRVAVEADSLQKRAGQLKARQDLRRRAGQMEHDPFAPLEGSKRRTVAVGQGTAGPVSASGSRGPESPTVSLGGAATGDHTTTGAGSSTTNTPSVGGPSSQTAGGPKALVSPGAAPSPTVGAAAADTALLSAQLRDLLDPATLAEIRRLEASGAPNAGIEALERAAAALRARADRLSGQSQALRAKARSSR